MCGMRKQMHWPEKPEKSQNGTDCDGFNKIRIALCVVRGGERFTQYFVYIA